MCSHRHHANMKQKYCIRVVLLIAMQIAKVQSLRDGSLTFVIDDTLSMKSTIEQVKAAVVDIMNIVKSSDSPIKNTVLVTFNDPDYDGGTLSYPKYQIRTVTTAVEELYQSLASINVHAGFDCPEYALTGIEAALNTSYSNSHLFVFTDASAKDYKKTAKVIELAERKSSTVIFIITPCYECNRYYLRWGCPDNYNIDSYERIAQATFGQVFRLSRHDEVQEVLKYVKSVSGGRTTPLVTKYLTSDTWHNVTFQVEENTEYVEISVSGINVKVENVNRLPGKTETITNIENVKIWRITKLKEGQYSIMVQGHGVTSVRVLARSDLTFQHGFIASDADLNTQVKQPTMDKEYRLLIHVDDDDSITINSVDILDMNRDVIQSLPLSEIYINQNRQSNFYISGLFMSPTHKFLIAVNGRGRYSNEATRVTSSPITPLIPHRKLTVTIEGQNIYEFNDKVSLKCKVKGHPEPKITWKDGRGKDIKSQITSTPNDYTSIPLDHNVQNETLYCEAANAVDSATAQTDIIIKPTFNFTKPQRSSVYLEYLQPAQLECGIESKHPMYIIWYAEGMKSKMLTRRFEINNTSRLWISADRKTLHFNEVTEKEIAPTYVCQAMLNDNPLYSVQTETRIKLKETELTVTIEGQNIYELNDKVSLKCKVQGYPEPKITWKDGRGKDIKSQIISTPNDYTSTPLDHNVKNETLYCEAANAVDSATAHTDITIKSTFNITKPQHSSVYFEYLQPAQLECGIESKYPMDIIWYAEGVKSKMLTRMFEINNTSRLWISADSKTFHFNEVTEKEIAPTYVCQAMLKDNPLYSVQSETRIKLKETAPEIKLSRNILEVIEGEPFSLKASALKGYPPPTYMWYFKERNEYKYVGDGNVYGENAASLIDHSGIYKCVATNTIDEDTKEVQVVVKSYPKIKLTTNVANNYKVPYNSLATLTCEVISHPKPVIRWRNSKGEVLNGETINTETPFTYASNLDVSTTNDFATYYCEATNELEKIEKSVDIKVDNPITSTGSGVVDVGYGQEAKLQCGIKSLFPLHITWFKEVNGTYEAIKPTNEFIMSSDGHDLKIRKIDIDLQGSYKCKGTLKMDENLKADYNVVVRINDLAAPKIEDIKEDYRLKEESNVVINCKVREGNPPPKLRWQFKGRTSAHFVDMTDVSIIKIENITLDQAGTYKCIAENIVGTDQKVFNVVVNAPPRIVSDNEIEYMGVAGDSATEVPCKVVGYPEPVISWETRGRQISTNDKFMVYQDYLLIMKPEVNDSSSYTCRADNTYGSDQKTFTVSISDNFMIDLDTDMQYARTGETVNFECPSEEGDKIQWMKELEPLDYTGSVYTIKNVSTIHDGNYTCRAFNGVTGDRYTPFALDVGYAPSFKQQTVNHEYDWAIKSVVQLDCDVTAKPDADVTWILNGKEIEASPYVLKGEFLKFNWGNYTCRVSNPHGIIERNFYVTSSNCIIRRSLKIGNMPLLVGNKTNNHDSLTIRHGENILLSCNNQPSTLKEIHGDEDTTDYINATCDMQDQYIVKDKTFNYRDLQCSSPVKPNIVATGDTCYHGSSDIIKVGFEAINTTIYEVCFAKNTSLPLYAKTVVTTDNSHNVELDDWLTYPKFGKDTRKYECIANSTCCLIKGQLVNGQEVMYGPAHTATFIDNLNSVPIWDSCEDSALTWSEYEENVRNQISPRGIPQYTAWTGTSQYEDGVPRFLWKVVRFETQSSDYPLVAVVKVNSPTPRPDDQLCSTPCPEIFWSTLHDSLYCCVIDEFVKVFNIPDNLFN